MISNNSQVCFKESNPGALPMIFSQQCTLLPRSKFALLSHFWMFVSFSLSISNNLGIHLGFCLLRESFGLPFKGRCTPPSYYGGLWERETFVTPSWQQTPDRKLIGNTGEGPGKENCGNQVTMHRPRCKNFREKLAEPWWSGHPRRLGICHWERSGT